MKRFQDFYYFFLKYRADMKNMVFALLYKPDRTKN